MTDFTGYVTLDETGASLQTVKLRNRQLVLSFMRANGAVSVNQISRATSLSKMTIHKILSHYLAEGLISHAGKGQSTEEGGKKPNLFIFNAHSRYLFAVRIGVHKLITTVATLRGEIIAESREQPLFGMGFGETVAAIGAAFRELMQANSLSPERFAAVAVSCNGIVDACGQCAVMYEKPEWGTNLPFKERLRIEIPSSIPIHIDCWWRYIAFAEAGRRTRTGEETFFLFGNSGDHIAGGLVVAGQVYRGRGGLAGELGHMTIDAPSAQSGVVPASLATVASPSAVVARAEAVRALNPESRLFSSESAVSLAAIASAAAAGAEQAGTLLAGLASAIAAAFGNIVLLCDPGTIVLYGDYARLGDAFLSRLRLQLADAGRPGGANQTRIECSNLSDVDGILGAATFITDSLFTRK
ncbi:MAG: ROK family protein [Planctomycetes bacterium]|nr:ROK family protein [Planctomycetota bacterium]